MFLIITSIPKKKICLRCFMLPDILSVTPPQSPTTSWKL
jgi:hypothetical protein